MHRSGTSAVAAVLDALVGSDLDPVPSRGNPAGQYEMPRLRPAVDTVLAAASRSFRRPPRPDHDWSDLPRRARRAVTRATASLGPEPWVWKDPRLSLCLPVWLAALDPGVLAVLVLRPPGAVVRSLGERDGTPPVLATALWERYLRCAITGLDGRPALVVPYEALVARPEAVVAEIAGVVGVTRGVTAAAARVSSPLPRSPGDDDADLRLNEIYEALAGDHARLEALTPDALGEEPAEVDALLADQPVPRRRDVWRTRWHVRRHGY